MNTRPVSALIIAAALSVSASIPLFAAPKNDLPVTCPVRVLVATSDGCARITRGMYRGAVSHAMRYNSRVELSPDVWVYSGFHADTDSSYAQECGTVVITFADDKVANLQLANRSAVAVLSTNLKFGSSTEFIASK